MVYFMLILMVVAGLFQRASPTACTSSTTGKEFVFGVLPYASGCCHDSRHIVALDITNVSPQDARVRLQIPFFKNDTYFNIPHGESKKITISNDIEKDRTFVESRGIKISSNSDISVLVSVVFNSPNTIDSYNVLPVSVVGKSYIISSYGSHGGRGRGGIVSIAGVSNNTNVTIVNGTQQLRSAVINMFDILQFLCDQCDLTGVKILSDKNVFVVSGSTFTGIPLQLSSEEYIASEMIPLSSLTRHYIVAPVLPKSAFMIRILSDMTFSVRVANLTKSFTVNPSLTELYFGTEALAVTAERPFSLTQYGVNYEFDSINGDPFMAAVPGVDQYISDYKFTVPRGYYGGVIHYVAVIIPEMYKNGLVLDGSSLRLYNTTTLVKSLQVPVPFDNYTILTFSVKEGFHHFFHNNETVTFGVFVYGHGYSNTRALSYAFYAGYNLEGHCTATDETSSWSPLTFTQTTYSTGISPTAKGPVCYNCEDLTHIDLCDTVKQCGKQEVCFIERYKESGQIKYKAGCLQENACEMKRNDSSYSEALCFECCHQNYCNNKGCGENGIPDRDRRGPICFDCQHVSSTEECLKVAPCDPHQVCRIEEYKWFDHSHFKLGCGHGLCDPVNRMSGHVFKRATPVCHSCCADDYCNRNCTTDPQGQPGSVIVG